MWCLLSLLCMVVVFANSFLVFTMFIQSKGIVKTTTPFVNATTLVICNHMIWDFTHNVGVSKIKVMSWQAGRRPLYEPFMAGNGLYYTRAGSRGRTLVGLNLCRRPHVLFWGAQLQALVGLGGYVATRCQTLLK